MCETGRVNKSTPGKQSPLTSCQSQRTNLITWHHNCRPISWQRIYSNHTIWSMKFNINLHVIVKILNSNLIVLCLEWCYSIKHKVYCPVIISHLFLCVIVAECPFIPHVTTVFDWTFITFMFLVDLQIRNHHITTNYYQVITRPFYLLLTCCSNNFHKLLPFYSVVKCNLCT